MYSNCYQKIPSACKASVKFIIGHKNWVSASAQVRIVRQPKWRVCSVYVGGQHVRSGACLSFTGLCIVNTSPRIRLSALSSAVMSGGFWGRTVACHCACTSPKYFFLKRQDIFDHNFPTTCARFSKNERLFGFVHWTAFIFLSLYQFYCTSRSVVHFLVHILFFVLLFPLDSSSWWPLVPFYIIWCESAGWNQNGQSGQEGTLEAKLFYSLCSSPLHQKAKQHLKGAHECSWEILWNL